MHMAGAVFPPASRPILAHLESRPWFPGVNIRQVQRSASKYGVNVKTASVILDVQEAPQAAGSEVGHHSTRVSEPRVDHNQGQHHYIQQKVRETHGGPEAAKRDFHVQVE